MAHYAYIDENNIVTDVIVGRDEDDLIEGVTSWEEYYGAIRTSYNARIRFNFAGIGYRYDPIDDAFIAPMPDCGHEELTLNELKRWECTHEECQPKII
tara:strand:- start:3233 stop:3526 length:294 start_codon:yes stop_codon:yes gene_type:complete